MLHLLGEPEQQSPKARFEKLSRISHVIRTLQRILKNEPEEILIRFIYVSMEFHLLEHRNTTFINLSNLLTY